MQITPTAEKMAVRERTRRGRCYHCGSTEHRAKSCPNVWCRTCGETSGHDAGACPRSNNPPPPPDMGSFAAYDGSSDNVVHHRTRRRPRNDRGSDENSSSHSSSTSSAAAAAAAAAAKSTTSHQQSPSLFTYVELFAGVGGFRVALDALGGRCVFASEIDDRCRSNYSINFDGDVPAGDIRRVPSDLIPRHDVLVGGFPCQPFSGSGDGLGLDDPRDGGRGSLHREICRVLRDCRPRCFLLENVRGLLLHDGGRTLRLIVDELEGCGYDVTRELVDAVRVLPQERNRLFLAGVRREEEDDDVVVVASRGGDGDDDVDGDDDERSPSDDDEGIATNDDVCVSRKKKKKSMKNEKFAFPRALPDLSRGVRDVIETRGMDPAELDRVRLSPRQVRKVRTQRYTRRHPTARFLTDTTLPAKTIQSSYMSYMVGSQFVSMTATGDAERSGDDADGEDDGDGDDDDDGSWRRFSAREVARMMGFPESFVLSRDGAHRMLGNAVCPPVVAYLAAPLLGHVGLGPPRGGGGGDGAGGSGEGGGGGEGGCCWGWNAAKSLLVEASPDDLRREELVEKLRTVSIRS